MKKYEVDEIFIKEAYKSTCDSWKSKIKDKFPDVFKNNLDYGKWLKDDSAPKWMIFQVDENNGFGFNSKGLYLNKYRVYDTTKDGRNRLATEQEVLEALFTEIEEKYPIGSQIKCVNGKNCEVKDKRMTYDFNKNIVTLNDRYYTFELFNNGVWAEIIPTVTELTLQEIANKFGVDVNNLKIKK